MTEWKRSMGCMTRDEQERLHESDDIKREFPATPESRHAVRHDTGGAGFPGGTQPTASASPTHSSPGSPGFNEDAAGQCDDPSQVILDELARGRQISHEIRREVLDCIVDSVRNMVWILNGRSDHRGSADDLELISAEVHDAGEDDRREAKRRARGEPPPMNRIERARQELRGGYSAICELERVLMWTRDARDRAAAVRASMASALALLEEVGR